MAYNDSIGQWPVGQPYSFCRSFYGMYDVALVYHSGGSQLAKAKVVSMQSSNKTRLILISEHKHI
jgi:hypothetical protein